jgi:predicted membrane-bound mannosyltransferase/plasmid stabilization system protein ParE
MLSSRHAILLTIAATAALAAALRFWRLDAAPLDAGEAVAALVARQMALGGGYEHFPGGQGPAQYIAGAIVFASAGITDANARAASALFGILLAVLPFALVRQIGLASAIAAALMLAVSPILITYSRIAGPEMILAFFTLALVAAVLQYLWTQNRAFLYLAAAVLALMFSTSEMALVVTPIFVAFLWYLGASDLFEQARGHAATAISLPAHYETLGVERAATARHIRDAYHDRLSPGLGRDDRERIAHAYGVLSNPRRRAAYDRRLRQSEASAAVQPATGAASRVGYGLGGFAIIAAWPLLAGWRERRGLFERPIAAAPMLLLSLLALPFYGPIVQKLWFVGDRGFEGQQMIYVIGGVSREPGGESVIMLSTLGALFAVAFALGIVWRAHVWFICWAIFYGTALTLFTSFFTNGGGVWTGLWGTLDYWWRPEADINREPALYYGGVLSVYAFVPVAIIAAATIFLAITGAARDRIAMLSAAAVAAVMYALPAGVPLVDPYRMEITGLAACIAVLAVLIHPTIKLFVFWTVAAFFAFSVVEQKQPALAIHIVVPATMLAAVILGRALAIARVPSWAREHHRAPARALTPRVAAASAFALVIIGVAFVSPSRPFASDQGPSLLRPAATSHDLRDARDALVSAGALSSQGQSLPVAVDTSAGFATPWLWYLRDYPNLQLQNMQRPFQATEGVVVIAAARNRERIIAPATVAAAYEHARTLADSPIAGPDAWAAGISGDLTADATEGIIFMPGLLAAALSSGEQSGVLGANTAP